jgi:hypothetical protein
MLKNWTVLTNPVDNLHQINQQIGSTERPTELVDPVGASYYVIAVVLVYGMSIVALIASHIKRKHGKLIEDKQINKYLREFQTVTEKQSRESYKNLKKRIKEQINWDKQTKTQVVLQHNLSQALLPMIAVGVSVPQLQAAQSYNNLKGSPMGSVHDSQFDIGDIRTRADSFGSSSTTATEAGDYARDQKRGLSNLIGNNSRDFPLEKILEESMNSQKSLYIKIQDTNRCTADKQKKTVQFGIETCEPDTSGHNVERSTGDNVVSDTRADIEFTLSDEDPSDRLKHSPISQQYCNKTHLSLPGKRNRNNDDIWLPSNNNSPVQTDLGTCNVGFKYSPLPNNSR